MTKSGLLFSWTKIKIFGVQAMCPKESNSKNV